MATMQRFLDPSVLASISSIDLIARTVVDGFIAGLHRSPEFGFSQEFAEYRAYTPGDDLRHIDWNVFARTERMYLKRFHGETNSQLLILLDASGSMSYSSGKVSKLDYARYLAASLAYMGSIQRDATGVIVFDDDVRNYIPPSGRQGQLMRALHAIESAVPGKNTDFAKPFLHFQQFLHRRGIVAVISDFYDDPEQVIDHIEPLRYRGNDVVLFHVVDPSEIAPDFRDPVLLEDMETGATLEVSPEFARNEYRERFANHMSTLKTSAQRGGIDYCLMNTGRPLDAGLREYLTLRQGRM
jgi:uncharacterized protein (DUF58 family)